MKKTKRYFINKSAICKSCNLWIFYSLLMFPLSLWSQRKPIDFVPKSPEAASFDKVTDIPVSMYTGTFNLSIPLYTVTSGDLSLPISLDYQGSAIRVDQESTWVGLNWLLNAGGLITTAGTVHDNPSNSYISPDDWKEDWNHLFNQLSFSTAYCDGSEFQTPYKIDGQQPMRGRYGANWFKCGIDYDKRNSNGDLSPELYENILDYHNGEAQSFHAVFLGKNINFVWDKFKNEFFITGIKSNFKITGTPGNFITITDGDGVKYDFSLIEKTFPIGSNVDMDHFTYNGTFYLVSIQSPTGHNIKLNYTDEGGFWPVRHINETLYDKNYPSNILNSIVSTDVLNQTVYDNLSLVRSITPYYVVNKKRLLSIIADSLTVNFNANTPRQDLNVGTNIDNYSKSTVNRLDNIEVSKSENGKKVIIKKYNFSYSYFAKNTMGGNTLKDYWKDMATAEDVYSNFYPNDNFMYLRLKLDKMWESAADGSVKPAYQFTYLNDLPGKNSSSQDYWGYYNGQENYNQKYHTMLPKSYGDTYDDVCSFKDYGRYLDGNGADRRSDYRYVTAGMLNSVMYPTGAIASFKYEQNTFDNCKYMTGAACEDPDDYYFNESVTTYVPTNSNNIDIITSDHEYCEPTYRRNICSNYFTLSSPDAIKWETRYTKNGLGLKNSYWKELFRRKVVLTTYGTTIDQNGNKQEIITRKDSICLQPKDTITSQISLTYVKSLNLAAGKYKIETVVLPQDKTSDDYEEIDSRMSSSNSTFTYNTKTETALRELHTDEPTLGNTTSVSNFVKKSVMTYDSNNNNCVVGDYNRNSQFFLIEKTCWVNIDASFMENSGRGTNWRELFSHPVLLYKYGVVNTQNGTFETIKDCSASTLNPSDTLNSSSSVSYHKSVLLAPGRYEIRIPEFIRTNNPPIFYEITACVSLSTTGISDNYFGNGIRIASVKRMDKDQIEETNYNYNDTTICGTSGRIMSPPVFSRNKLLIYQPKDNNPSTPQAKEISYTIVSSDNLNPNNSSIGYSQVTLTQTGSNGQKNGKRIYNFWNNLWGAGPFWNFMKRPEDPRNGNVIGDCIYDNAGNIKVLTKTSSVLRKVESRMLSAVIENLYSGPNYITGAGGFNVWQQQANGGIMDIYLYSSAQFATSSSTTTTTSIESNGKITKEKETSFNIDNCQPQREKTSTSKIGEYDVTDCLYPNDYNNQPWIDSLKVKNITNKPLQIIHSLSTPKGNYLTDSNLLKYNLFGQLSEILTKEINGKTLLADFSLSNQNGFDTKEYYTDETIIYNNKSHNPQVVTDKYSMNTVYIWGYNNMYPIAVIKGATMSQVSSILNEIDKLESMPFPTLATEELYRRLSYIQGALVTTYKFNPYIGITNCIKPNGESVTYEYDSFSRLTSISNNTGVLNKYYYNYKK